jgi:hypothetical protein
MSRPAVNGNLKQARDRAARKAAGMKEMPRTRFDGRAPGFREQLEREMAAMRGDPDEARVRELIEALTDLPPYEE